MSVPGVPERHRADGENARTHPPAASGADLDGDGRVAPEVFLHEGIAALDRPRLTVEHKVSGVLKPSRQRRRGSQPRSETPSVRFTRDEITLLEQAAAERGPSLSGFMSRSTPPSRSRRTGSRRCCRTSAPCV